jgi:hypothetical protein
MQLLGCTCLSSAALVGRGKSRILSVKTGLIAIPVASITWPHHSNRAAKSVHVLGFKKILYARVIVQTLCPELEQNRPQI